MQAAARSNTKLLIYTNAKPPVSGELRRAITAGLVELRDLCLSSE